MAEAQRREAVAWVAGYAFDREGAGIMITLDLGGRAVPPGLEGRLKVVGGDFLRHGHFKIRHVKEGVCEAWMDLAPGLGAEIVELHNQGRLVAVITGG